MINMHDWDGQLTVGVFHTSVLTHIMSTWSLSGSGTHANLGGGEAWLVAILRDIAIVDTVGGAGGPYRQKVVDGGPGGPLAWRIRSWQLWVSAHSPGSIG